MADPTPSSANESIDNIFENKPFNPRYSTERNITKTLRDIIFIIIPSIWPVKANFKLLIEFSSLLIVLTIFDEVF